jgi:2'-5' RNA ligase
LNVDETRGQNLLRLFAAVELPAEARRAAAAHAARLRASSGQQGLRVGWEREEKLHLTLKFLGGVEPERAGALTAALSSAARVSYPFALSLEATGVFPAPSRPSALWLGISDPSGELARLHARLEDECARANFARELKPFRPHVTLARVRAATREARHLARHHLELAFAPVSFHVTEIVLVSSRLGPGGSVHTPLSRHTLGAIADETPAPN